MRWIRLLAGLGVVTLAGATLYGQPAASAAPGDPGRQVVTLLTGDRVELGSRWNDMPRVRPARGREKMAFSVRRDRNHAYVVPADAIPGVSSGRLDIRLFDAAGLLSLGYGDAKRADLPLIVQRPHGLRSAALPAGARLVRDLSAVDSVAVAVGKTDGTFWRHALADKSVKKLWLTGKRAISLDRSVPQIGAPAGWQAGLTGKGVKVAVLDTGIDTSHPDLAGRVVDSRDFTGTNLTDTVGHGTHVAATVASVDQKFRGVAYEASLLNGKVCFDRGCPDDAIIAGMQWAAESGAKVVNLSLGGSDQPGVDPMEDAVNQLSAKYGTLFVIAAGNSRDAKVGSVSSPATADAALAVGAVDRQDAMASFSNRGPRQADAGVKPEITAPGVGIVAARSKDGQFGEPGETHVALDGTSMATPHVVGAAALLAQQHPQWTAAQLKAALIASAKPKPGVGAYEQGAGRVDVARAIGQPVTADPPSQSFGLMSWPHADDKPVTKTITYRNSGTTDLTLALRLDAPDVFQLSSQTVTVKAGGTASVDVTADTRGPIADRAYAGQLIATSGAISVSTPIGVVREVESYDVTFSAIDKDGKPNADNLTHLVPYATGDLKTLSVDGGTRLRLPRGDYALDTMIDGGDRLDYLVQPWLHLTADTKVVFDARLAKPIGVRMARQDASLFSASIGNVVWSKENGTGVAGGPVFMDFASLGTAQLGPNAPTDRFAGSTRLVFVAPEPKPAVYNLSWFTPGRAYTGTRTVRDSQLAAVRITSLPQGPGAVGSELQFASFKALHDAPTPPGRELEVPLPSTRDEFFTTEGLRWSIDLREGTDPEMTNWLSNAPSREYRAGHRYTETWNGRGVFGPSLPGPASVAAYAAATEGGLRFSVPLYGTAADIIGTSKVDSARTVVTSGDKQICASTRAATCVTDSALAVGTYRIATDASRSLTDLSTKTSVVWTVKHDGTETLPVQVVRFDPRLDDANSAPGGRKHRVAVDVQRNPGAKPARLASLTVDVSYDDGKTWQSVPVVRGAVELRHPSTGYVSLRAHAADTLGNTVTQTILHAYRLR